MEDNEVALQILMEVSFLPPHIRGSMGENTKVPMGNVDKHTVMLELAAEQR